MALTRIEDVVVPDLFSPYVLRRTAERSPLVQSGAVVVSPELSASLSGGGLTFTHPFFKDLVRVESNVSSDEESDYYTGGSNDSVPRKIATGSEVQIRQSRNASWSTADLTRALAGADPMQAIGDLVADYWAWDNQASLISTVNGIFADNDAAPGASEHVQGDLSNDISGTAYSAGVTDIGGGAFIDALVTMGDAMDELALMMVHSIPYSRLLKNNEIEFVRASDTDTMLATYKGKTIIKSDYMPNTGGVYDTWLFGPGAIALGLGTPDVPTETKRHPDSGNGGGSEVLYNRLERSVHPIGHAYVGAQANGGPSNAEQANGASWERRFSERKQIRIARLRSRET